MRVNAPDFEHQERLAIRFRAGSDSVFGDGALVESDLCQHCVLDVLGPWLINYLIDEAFNPVLADRRQGVNRRSDLFNYGTSAGVSLGLAGIKNDLTNSVLHCLTRLVPSLVLYLEAAPVALHSIVSIQVVCLDDEGETLRL